jgi:Antitoxin ParD
MGYIKTTLEIPDQLFRRAKATAAERGQSLKEFVAEALLDKLSAGRGPVQEQEWMQGFGQLKHLHEETVRVQATIDEEFEVIEPEDRR